MRQACCEQFTQVALAKRSTPMPPPRPLECSPLYPGRRRRGFDDQEGLTKLRNRLPWIAALLAASLSLFAIACSDSDESDSWKIGLEAPLTGDQAQLGQGMLQGAQLASSQLNSAGGLLGRDVEIVPIDDQADPEVGVDAANEAIESGLDGVVGPYNSGVGLETLPLYQDAGLVPIRLTSDVGTNGMGFTLQPMTNQIAPVATGALTDWLKADKVAIAYDSSTDYTNEIARSVRSLLEKQGVEVVAFEQIKPGQKSYADEVGALAASGADVVYGAVYFPEGAAIAKEMLKQKVAPACLLDYGSYDSGFVADAGEAAAKICPVVGVPAWNDFKGSADFGKAFRDDFDTDLGTWSPYTYDSVNFLAEAVKATDGFEADAVTDFLDGVSGWMGWTGSVTIDPETGNRDPATVVVTTLSTEDGADGELRVDQDWAKAVGAPY